MADVRVSPGTELIPKRGLHVVHALLHTDYCVERYNIKKKQKKKKQKTNKQTNKQKTTTTTTTKKQQQQLIFSTQAT